jgi:hypothetical protein
MADRDGMSDYSSHKDEIDEEEAMMRDMEHDRDDDDDDDDNMNGDSGMNRYGPHMGGPGGPGLLGPGGAFGGPNNYGGPHGPAPWNRGYSPRGPRYIAISY